jgi:hypothetical protein
VALNQARTLFEQLSDLKGVVDPAGGAVEVPVPDEQRARYLPTGPTPGRQVAEAERAAAEAAWALALQRGYRHREQALAGIGPVLNAREAAERLGVSLMTVANWRRRHKVLGLRFDDHRYLFPVFQFAASPEEGERGVLRGFDEVLAALGDRPDWTRARFFTGPSPALGGRTPLAVLRESWPAARERLLAVAREAGEMGE